MELVIKECKPSDMYLQPCLLFTGEIIYRDRAEAILAIDGYLVTDDNKMISKLSEIHVQDSEKEKSLAARGTTYDNLFKDKAQKIQLIAPISKIGLNYIEERRGKNKRDVKLKISLNVKALINKAVISHNVLINPKDIGFEDLEVRTNRGLDRHAYLLANSYNPEFSTNTTNLWLISGDGSPIFLSVTIENLAANYHISQSDWIKDYASQLGLGDYYIIELKKEKHRIEKAWSYLSEAEKCYIQWDIKGVYANCREIKDLLNKLMEDNFGKDGFVYKERWGRAVGRFEHLSSLALHIEDTIKKGSYSLDQIEIGKAEADHLILVTKSLVKYAEDLLQDCNSP